MSTFPTDRLFALLPYVHRMRDGERGDPLRTFLRVIERQVDVLERDLDRLYDNWFIETCDEAMVPYLGELIGWAPTARAGEPGEVEDAEGRLLRRSLAPRADVARTLAHRRRKGTLALLEELARTAAGWPAHAVEFYRGLSYAQSIKHLRLDRGRTFDVRARDAIAALGGAFDRSAHTIDVRRPTSHRSRGRWSIPSVGVFAWRLQPWSVTETQAYLHEGVVDRDPRRRAGDQRRGCFSFDLLGRDVPLFIRPTPEPDPASISALHQVPAPLSRHALARDLERYYGAARSLCVWLGTDRSEGPTHAVAVEQVAVADLSEWAYRVPDDKTVLIDPELGRFKVRLAPAVEGRPTADDPVGGAQVTYHHGFARAMGGGEYDRALDTLSSAHAFYVVGDAAFATLEDAIDQWRADAPPRAIIEIATRRPQLGPVRIELAAGQTLIVRAADRLRATVRLLDERADARDGFVVAGDRGSRFVCDGLWVSGRGVTATGPMDQVVFRHCTLVPPPWSDRHRPSGPPASLVLDGIAGDVLIDRCIVGPIAVPHGGEPMRVKLVGSIVDAGHRDDDAVSDGPNGRHARAALTIQACTIFGRVTTHAVDLAENSLFEGLVRVARRVPGCIRFCYVPPGSRTPRRYHCQPDLVVEAQPLDRDDLRAVAADRVRPVWTTRRHGLPGYAQLWRDVALELARGADDEGEMGAFHDLYWPQREDVLAQRLAESVPVGTEAGIFFST